MRQSDKHGRHEERRLKCAGWTTWASAPMLGALPEDGDGPFISLTEAHHNLAIVLQPPIGGANYLNSPGGQKISALPRDHLLLFVALRLLIWLHRDKSRATRGPLTGVVCENETCETFSPRV